MQSYPQRQQRHQREAQKEHQHAATHVLRLGELALRHLYQADVQKGAGGDGG